MKSSQLLLVCRAPAEARHSFIVAGDDDSLRRLSESFHGLDPRKPFKIGDGDCVIIVEASGNRSATMTRPATGPIRWLLPVGEARRYGDMIAAMAKHRGPCHHYLQAASNLPPIHVTKGEYDAATLNRMRATPA